MSNTTGTSTPNTPAVRAQEVAIIEGASVDQLLAQSEKVLDVMKRAMKPGIHFGTIRGCGDKPTLLQPGAQKLCLIFGLVPTYQEVISVLPGKHREFRIVCTLHTRAGMLAGQGIASGSTMEKKWRYVNGMEHPNIENQYNTCLKITAKRAFVAAVNTALATSDIFSQDLEDMDPADLGLGAQPAPAVNQQQVYATQSHPTPNPSTPAPGANSFTPRTANEWDVYYGQFAYRYNIPYKESQNPAVKALLKEKECKFRGDKNRDKTPNGDLSADKNWYTNYNIPEFAAWLNPIPKAAAEVFGNDDVAWEGPPPPTDADLNL